MPISYFTESVKMPGRFPKRKLNQWIKDVSLMHQKIAGKIVYVFSTQEKVFEINRKYLEHYYYTDIITFDYSTNDTIHGDLYISLETVEINAEIYQTTFKEELYRVMIHGILHLCGIKDKTPKQKKKMRKEENKALDILRSVMNF